jgi:hypothetical protein
MLRFLQNINFSYKKHIFAFEKQKYAGIAKKKTERVIYY